MRKVLTVAILSACSLPIACARTNETGTGSDMNKETAFVFVDRSDPELEYVYVVSERGIVAQVSVFPGYTNRRIFRVPRLPETLGTEAKRWERLPGEITPPFVPGEPWFSRSEIRLDAETPTKEAYFRDSNEGLHKWLHDLRKALVKEEYRLTELPRWIAENKRITRELGM